MTSFKRLSNKQLADMLTNTKAELERREHIQDATAEIMAILKKYKITLQDIDLQALNKKTLSKAVSRAKANTSMAGKRARAKAKYANPNGNEKWSGRGRAPLWVLEICEKEGIDEASFKKSNRFIIG